MFFWLSFPVPTLGPPGGWNVGCSIHLAVRLHRLPTSIGCSTCSAIPFIQLSISPDHSIEQTVGFLRSNIRPWPPCQYYFGRSHGCAWYTESTIGEIVRAENNPTQTDPSFTQAKHLMSFSHRHQRIFDLSQGLAQRSSVAEVVPRKLG